MRPDIVNLREFYSSQLGRRVKGVLRRAVRRHWQLKPEEPIIGIGYATPILQALERGGKPAIALMPSAMGAIYWPVHGSNRSVLGDTLRPPFAPNSLRRILVVHGLEFEEKPEELLAIAWELLAPGGSICLIIPNRHGLWARMGRTPFTQGKTTTASTIKAQLASAKFTLRGSSAALFSPPSAHPLWHILTWPLEWLGRALCPMIGGVWVLDAEKQIYAGLSQPLLQKVSEKWAENAAAALHKHAGLSRE